MCFGKRKKSVPKKCTFYVNLFIYLFFIMEVFLFSANTAKTKTTRINGDYQKGHLKPFLLLPEQYLM